jgi:ubiquinone/menaquinone biosynthesis C-methylase UbiE
MPTSATPHSARGGPAAAHPQAAPKARLLSAGYPGLEELAAQQYTEHQAQNDTTLATMRCIGRLVDLSRGLRTVAVIGCGPNPYTLDVLVKHGFDATGVEPVEAYMRAARDFLKDDARVELGSAESLPYADGSQRVVLLENVFEHVDSPSATLAEAYRVLAPGGVLYVYTTNRFRFSLVGRNWEFRTPFYNWFPATLKEAYVHHHLHFDPRLANYSLRPAVHWWSYADLCRSGRLAGFAQFYTRFDLVEDAVVGSWRDRIRNAALHRVRRSPWLRALALLQFGNSVFMLKRPFGGV